MLPAAHRLRESSAFSVTTRSGQRARRDCVVVYVRMRGDDEPTRLGLIVSKAVGNSVARHRVSRRIRAGLATWVAQAPAGSDIVVRALPDAVSCPDFVQHLREAASKAHERAQESASHA